MFKLWKVILDAYLHLNVGSISFLCVVSVLFKFRIKEH